MSGRPLPLALLSLSALLAAAAPCAARGKAKAAAPEPALLLQRSLAPTASSYEGLLVVEWTEGGAARSKRVAVRYQKPGLYRREVLDAAGQPAQVAVSDGKSEWIYDRAKAKVWTGEAADPDVKRLSQDEELELLTQNYELSSATAPAVAGRPCWELAVRARADGRLRRRELVDRRTGLVLAFEEYGPQGGLARSSHFERVSFGARQARKNFAFAPPPGAAVVRRAEADFKAIGEAKAAAGFEPKTPSWLPQGFVFESLDVLPRGERKIVHYRFSDGVSVLSLFQFPPKVKLDLSGKSSQKVRVGADSGALAWTAEGQALSWKRGRSSFMLVGPLPAETLIRIAGSVQ